MKDNKKSLPSNKKRVKYSYSRYRRVRFCKLCREFEENEILNFYDDCCPGCGCETFHRTVGRYKIKTTKLFLAVFSDYRQDVIGFLPKSEDGSKCEEII